jgi:4a-hydroxytetrahydrobiopterin dehydratase
MKTISATDEPLVDLARASRSSQSGNAPDLPRPAESQPNGIQGRGQASRLISAGLDACAATGTTGTSEQTAGIVTASGTLTLRDVAYEEPISRGDREMETLTQMKCVACRKDAPTVTAAEIAEFHPQVSDWEIVELDGIKRLRRVLSFDDFAQALEFTKKVGELAEEEGHHPALLTEWGRTTVTWWTHKIKGLHRNDFIMAAKTDELYQP